jgi:uncharacterized protein YhhL (DUF1145 family)
VFAGFAALMMAMLPATLITQEDKFKAMTLGCSLPVSRKAIVQARFVLALGMSLTGILGAFVLGVLVPSSRYAFGDLFAGIPLITAITWAGVLLSLFLPFTLRFGLKGLMIFIVVMQVLGVALLTLARLSRSSMDRVIIEGIAGFFSRLYASLGPNGFNLFMVAAISLLLSASYLVSVRLFVRREL